jgi:gliding motility-associated-like protein
MHLEMKNKTGILVMALSVLWATGFANTAEFTHSAVCLGSQSVFSSTSVASGGETIVLWEWDLDADGQFTDASGPVVSTVFPAAGTFQVGLRITTDFGSEVVAYRLVTVNPVPVADFSAPDVCKGANTLLTSTSSISAGSVVLWEWDLDNDGQYDDANEETVTYNFGNDGGYVVGLRVTSDLGCQSTTTGSVVVDPQPTVNFAALNFCLGNQTQFTAITSVGSGLISSLAWEWNGNNLFDDATGPTASTQFISDGNYLVGLKATSDQGCVADTFKLVTIAPYPYINFSFNTACQDEAVQFNNFTGNVVGTISYQWTFGTFGSSIQQAPSFTFQNSGTFPVTLTGTTSFGCAATLTQNVTVKPKPTADFTFTEVCLGFQTEFGNTSSPNGGSIQSYLWNFADANVSVATNPIHFYIASGVYNVRLITYSTDGCRDTVVKPVNVWALPEPVITANGPIEFCDGGVVGIEVNPEGVSRLWNTGEQTKGILVTTSGLYTVAVIDANGCRGEDSFGVTVNPLPVINVTNDTTVSLGEDAPLWANGASTYTWTPETFLDNPNTSRPVSSPTSTITYTVTGEDANGCVSSADVTVSVLVDYNLVPVNLFTPNADGTNERFFIRNIDEYSDCKVSVFNRYGNLVFSAKPYNNDWTGTMNDSPLPEGTYYYIIDCDGRPDRFDGAVTILRGK